MAFTAQASARRKSGGKEFPQEIVIEIDTPSSSKVSLIPMSSDGKGRNKRIDSQKWVVERELFDKVVLGNARRASASGTIVEALDDKIKVTLGSGSKRTELVMTRYYLHMTFRTIKELRTNPHKYR